jgi:hypothetical protein
MSADAHLAFGIQIPGSDVYFKPGENAAYDWMEALHEAHEDDEDWSFDFEDYLAEQHGLTNPYEEHAALIESMRYPEYKEWLTDEGKWFDELTTAYHGAKKTILDASPVEMVYYGYSDGYGQQVLALKDTHIYAYGYSAKAIDLGELMCMVSVSAILDAEKFCESYQLPPFDDPKWWLMPSYG